MRAALFTSFDTAHDHTYLCSELHDGFKSCYKRIAVCYQRHVCIIYCSVLVYLHAGDERGLQGCTTKLAICVQKYHGARMWICTMQQTEGLFRIPVCQQQGFLIKKLWSCGYSAVKNWY